MNNLGDLLEQEGIGILTPENVEPHIVEDLQRAPSLQRFAAKILQKARVNAIAAASRRLELAQAVAATERTPIDGLGQPVMTITQDDMNFLCRKYGPGWFRDKATREDTLRRHPEMRPRVQPRRTMIVVDGLRGGAEVSGQARMNGAQGRPPAPPAKDSSAMKTARSRPLSSVASRSGPGTASPATGLASRSGPGTASPATGLARGTGIGGMD